MGRDAAKHGLGLLVLVVCLGARTAVAGVCVAPDAGWGTAHVPPDPARCLEGYRSTSLLHWPIEDAEVPAGIVIDARHRGFFPLGVGLGGRLNGEYFTFDSELELQMRGTGALADFRRTITVPLPYGEMHVAPRNHGEQVQAFESDLFRLQGFVIGDRDFDKLEIRAGRQLGLPSPGEAVLARLGPPGSDFNVHGHVDLTYEVEFVGSPHGGLSGVAGTRRGTARMTIGQPLATSDPAVPLWAALGPFALLGLALYRASF